jgi:hypothetical protein
VARLLHGGQLKRVMHCQSRTKGLVGGRAPVREDALEVLTLEEAAALLRGEEPALLAIAEQGDVPRPRIGEEWRFFAHRSAELA